VALDDAGADGQPHPHSLRLGGIERVKNLLQPLGLNAAAGIGDLDDHVPVRVAVLRVMVLARSFTSAIASTAFITRFNSTCWICTLSPVIKLSWRLTDNQR
jgi:hypothetical protein